MRIHPILIQGGMGVGISDWRLARAVSRLGGLGVVSGTALDQVLARRLQAGDPDGEMRHALDHFPVRAMAERFLKEYFIPGGKQPNAPYKALPMHSKESSRELRELCIVANFVEVFLAREGHRNPVGIKVYGFDFCFGCGRAAPRFACNNGPFSPCYHAQNSCFLAQIRVTDRTPAAKSELPCPQFFCWREKAEISRPWVLDTTRNQRFD